ncbi:MAG: KH domain-containing protein [Thermoplasmataceae archaeon]
MEAGVVLVPKERLPMIIGREGMTKRKLEKLGNVALNIDSAGGLVSVEQKNDALKANLTLSVVHAISRGFNPEVAFSIFDDYMQLIVISLRDFAKPGSRRIEEIRGRIIGRGGKTRRVIESLTSTHISVYGDTVSIIGDYVSIQYSREAISMIISGKKHRSVYQYLEKKAKEIKFKRIEESFG